MKILLPPGYNYTLYDTMTIDTEANHSYCKCVKDSAERYLIHHPKPLTKKEKAGLRAFLKRIEWSEC